MGSTSPIAWNDSVLALVASQLDPDGNFANPSAYVSPSSASIDLGMVGDPAGQNAVPADFRLFALTFQGIVVGTSGIGILAQRSLERGRLGPAGPWHAERSGVRRCQQHGARGLSPGLGP